MKFTLLPQVREAFPYLAAQADFIEPGVLRRRIAYIEFAEARESLSEGKSNGESLVLLLFLGL